MKKAQPLVIRITHWVNIPVLVVLAASGLQILLAYPFFGPRGEPWDWVPLQGWVAPEWMRMGGWLAGARHLHFLFAWFFVITGLVYMGYVIWSREYRRRFFWPPRDLKPMFQQLAYYVRLREEPPPKNLYNGLQRSAYTFAIVLAILEVLSGFAMWKPVQLWWLAWLMGGYESARVIHFLALLGLMVFAVAHVIMVLIHPKSIVEMITGGKRETT